MRIIDVIINDTLLLRTQGLAHVIPKLNGRGFIPSFVKRTIHTNPALNYSPFLSCVIIPFTRLSIFEV